MIVIAGPCQLESSEHAIATAKHCKSLCDKYGFQYYFKSSFDKANRTSIHGKRGPGIFQGLGMLSDVKTEVECKVLTDVHETWQIKEIAPIVDVIQIPAFLCRQTDLLVRAVEIASLTNKKVNIKKGQFLAPWDIKGILSKTGTENVWITDRGTSFGYNTLVTDFTGIQYMRKEFDVPIIFDATHSVQRPGGRGDTSGGNREYVPGLIRAAVAQGIDGVFIECHENPDEAPSDGPNSIYTNSFEQILKDIQKFNYEVKKDEDRR